MFTRENPCTGNDLLKFRSWWETVTKLNALEFEKLVDSLRLEIVEYESQIQEAFRRLAFLSTDERATIGRIQTKIIPARVRLAEMEAGLPNKQPEMILYIERVQGFELKADQLLIKTSCLYGRDFRSPQAPWCRIGHFEISIDANGRLHSAVRVNIRWRNLDKNARLDSSMDTYPAPQVDASGYRNCMGDLAHQHIYDGFSNGQIYKVIGTIIRYTEQPKHGMVIGTGMGEFPTVPESDVPEFYLKAFPRR